MVALLTADGPAGASVFLNFAVFALVDANGAGIGSVPAFDGVST